MLTSFLTLQSSVESSLRVKFCPHAASISILDQYFHFWRKILIFEQDFHFWRKILIFEQDFHFWRKISIFDQYFIFGPKISSCDHHFLKAKWPKIFRPIFRNGNVCSKISILATNFFQNFPYGLKCNNFVSGEHVKKAFAPRQHRHIFRRFYQENGARPRRPVVVGHGVLRGGVGHGPFKVVAATVAARRLDRFYLPRSSKRTRPFTQSKSHSPRY